MQWRVMVEVSGAVGAKQVHEVHAGGSATPGCSATTLGLSLAEAKAVLAGLQRHLVQAQAEEHCQIRRRCPRCGGQRPLKDRRPRQLRSLFGTVEVRAPRFEPCQCSVTLRTILSPVKEIMPDCCTPEYERVLAEFGALLPYRRARALLETFFPVGDLPTQRRKLLRCFAQLGIEAPNAEAYQCRFHSVDETRTLAHQLFTLAVRTLGILLVQRRDRRHGAVLFLTTQPAQDGTLQKPNIQPVGLETRWPPRGRTAKPLQKTVSGAEPARHSKAEDEPSAARVHGIADQHGGNGEQAESGKRVHQAPGNHRSSIA